MIDPILYMFFNNMFQLDGTYFFIFYRYVDLFVVSTHNITEVSKTPKTYHHSRLMGLSDILNMVNFIQSAINLQLIGFNSFFAFRSLVIDQCNEN